MQYILRSHYFLLYRLIKYCECKIHFERKIRVWTSDNFTNLYLTVYMYNAIHVVHEVEHDEAKTLWSASRFQMQLEHHRNYG